MAQKLKFGNGTWATKEGSTLAYNDENGNYKPLPFSVSRASTATRVNKQGLIEVVGRNKARVDYSETSNGALLLEPSRTNLFTYSEDLSNAAWSKTNSLTITTNIAIAPDGNNTADGIQDETGVTFKLAQQSSKSVSSNSTVTGSVFVKKETSEINYGGFQFDFTGGARKLAYVAFDAVNGLAISLSGASLTPSSIKVVDFNSDWWRLEITVTDTGSNTSLAAGYYGTLSNNFSTVSVGAGSVRTLWGFQLEIGSYSTSYIPTSGSSVTRVADAANNCGNSAVFNDSEGVLYANIAALANDGTVRGIAISDNSASDRVYIFLNVTSNQIFGRVDSVNSTVFSESYILNNSVENNKISLKYKANDFALWVNGFEVAAITSGATPVGLYQIQFDNGAGAGGAPFYGKSKELGYYDAALTDAELEYLTSYRSLAEMVTELNLNQL